jgi:hypothetical protein
MLTHSRVKLILVKTKLHHSKTKSLIIAQHNHSLWKKATLFHITTKLLHSTTESLIIKTKQHHSTVKLLHIKTHSNCVPQHIIIQYQIKQFHSTVKLLNMKTKLLQSTTKSFIMKTKQLYFTIKLRQIKTKLLCSATMSLIIKTKILHSNAKTLDSIRATQFAWQWNEIPYLEDLPDVVRQVKHDALHEQDEGDPLVVGVIHL